MPNISQIQVGTTTYDLIDNIARNASIPSGGNTNQFLKKNTNTDYDVSWSDIPHHTYYVKGTQTGTTGNWTGNLPEVEALYEGLSIDYYLPYAGSGNATLNLTLKNGVQTGAVPCYYGSTGRLTTQIPQYYICHLTYQTVTINNVEYTGWYISRAVDNDGIGQNLRIIQILKADSAIYRYQLLFHTDVDTVTPLNNVNNTTGTSKAMLTNVDFDAFARIYYYNVQTTINAGQYTAANYVLYYQHGLMDLRYSINCGSTLTTNELVYLKVIPQSNGMVRLAPDPCWAQELPTTADGYWYILLGRAYSTYQLSLFPDHPVYYNDGTRIMQAMAPNMALTGAPTAPTPASGDDSTKIATTEWVTDVVSSATTEVQNTLNNKQDKLTFDIIPTVGSTNPVYSAGVASVVSNIISQLNGKASTSSPIFEGTPQAPTATSTENSDQIATTKFVQNLFSSIDSPNLNISVSTETLYIKF